MMMYGGGFGMLLMLLFWGGVIALPALLIGWLILRGVGRGAGPYAPYHRYEEAPPWRSSAGRPPTPERDLPAAEIARRRYATGEITRDEYVTLLRDLDQPAG
ncbi:MAG: hypothetical protein Kow00124_25960 [Anaerolineae bacterium]